MLVLRVVTHLPTKAPRIPQPGATCVGHHLHRSCRAPLPFRPRPSFFYSSQQQGPCRARAESPTAPTWCRRARAAHRVESQPRRQGAHGDDSDGVSAPGTSPTGPGDAPIATSCVQSTRARSQVTSERYEVLLELYPSRSRSAGEPLDRGSSGRCGRTYQHTCITCKQLGSERQRVVGRPYQFWTVRAKTDAAEKSTDDSSDARTAAARRAAV